MRSSGPRRSSSVFVLFLPFIVAVTMN